MRNLILATVSAIALGIAGAGPLYAQNADTNPTANPASPAAQSPAATTPQPAMPQAETTTQPSMSGNNQYSNPDMAAGSQSGANWGQLSRADIRQIQSKLRQAGLYHGRIDGLEGPATQQALRIYQRQNGLPVTGTPDQQTASSILRTGTGVGSSTAPNSSNDMNMPPSSNAGAGGASNPPNKQ